MHAIVDVRQLPGAADQAEICGSRGYCGPFANQAFYAAYPDAFWHGMGDCVLCGTTRRVESGAPLGQVQLNSAA